MDRDPFPLIHLSDLSFTVTVESVASLPTSQLLLTVPEYDSEKRELTRAIVREFRRRRELNRDQIKRQDEIGIFASVELRRKDYWHGLEFISFGLDLSNGVQNLTSAELLILVWELHGNTRELAEEAEDIFTSRREKDKTAGLRLEVLGADNQPLPPPSSLVAAPVPPVILAPPVLQPQILPVSGPSTLAPPPVTSPSLVETWLIGVAATIPDLPKLPLPPPVASTSKLVAVAKKTPALPLLPSPVITESHNPSNSSSSNHESKKAGQSKSSRMKAVAKSKVVEEKAVGVVEIALKGSSSSKGKQGSTVNQDSTKIEIKGRASQQSSPQQLPAHSVPSIKSSMDEEKSTTPRQKSIPPTRSQEIISPPAVVPVVIQEKQGVVTVSNGLKSKSNSTPIDESKSSVDSKGKGKKVETRGREDDPGPRFTPRDRLREEHDRRSNTSRYRSRSRSPVRRRRSRSPVQSRRSTSPGRENRRYDDDIRDSRSREEDREKDDRRKKANKSDSRSTRVTRPSDRYTSRSRSLSRTRTRSRSPLATFNPNDSLPLSIHNSLSFLEVGAIQSGMSLFDFERLLKTIEIPFVGFKSSKKVSEQGYRFNFIRQQAKTGSVAYETNDLAVAAFKQMNGMDFQGFKIVANFVEAAKSSGDCWKWQELKETCAEALWQKRRVEMKK